MTAINPFADQIRAHFLEKLIISGSCHHTEAPEKLHPPQHPRSLASTTEDKVNFVPIKLYNIEKRIKMPISGKDVI